MERIKNLLTLLLAFAIVTSLVCITNITVKAEELEEPQKKEHSIRYEKWINATKKEIWEYSFTTDKQLCFVRVSDTLKETELGTSYHYLLVAAEAGSHYLIEDIEATGTQTIIEEKETKYNDLTELTYLNVGLDLLTEEVPGYTYYDLINLNTSIPIFENNVTAYNYMTTGDDSGQINKPSIMYDETFSLTGFECNNSIYATWTGVTNGESSIIDLDKVFVTIKPVYFLILESGEEEKNFFSLDTVEVPFTNYNFYKLYDEYFIDNPYVGRCQLILYFTPCYMSEKINECVTGKSIVVKFDENGNITNLDIPESSLMPCFNSNLEFNNFSATSEFNNWGDSYIHCFWNGVNTDINYIYSDIKVQLFASPIDSEDNISHEWIDYDFGENISFNTNRLSFNLTALDDFCYTKGYRFSQKNYKGNYSGERIRLIPYCKTPNSYFYGKSVEITLSKLGGINSIMQSVGDALTDANTNYSNLENNYISDGTLVEDIIDGFYSDENTDINIDIVASDFFNSLSSFFKLCGQFPSLVENVLGFLPSYYSKMLIVALGLVILMRIIGR